MFADTTNEVVGYADIEGATDATGEDVDVETARAHQASLGYWVARSSRAMTTFVYSPACNWRGSGKRSVVSDLTRRGASSGASDLLKSSSSMRPARFSILSAEIRIWRTSSLAWPKWFCSF